MFLILDVISSAHEHSKAVAFLTGPGSVEVCCGDSMFGWWAQHPEALYL